MSSINHKEEIPEGLDELLQIERSQNKARSRDRVRFLRLLKEGIASSQQQAAKMIGLSHRQCQALWKHYKDHGLAKFISNSYRKLGLNLVLLSRIVCYSDWIREITLPSNSSSTG